jgi:hypothetical protein
MSGSVNRKQTPEFSHSNQLELFNDICFDVSHALKLAMKAAIRESKFSREQIVDRINSLAEIAGVRATGGRSRAVTIAVLEKWLAPDSVEYQIPIRFLPLLCRAVESNLPLIIFSTAFSGVKIISDEDSKILDWAQAALELTRAKRRAKKLFEKIGEAAR